MEDSVLLNDNVCSEAEDDLLCTQVIDNRVLKGVMAYVEVRSTNDNRSEAVRRELVQLGAFVVKKFTSDVTHVIFKEGSNRTKTKAQKKCIHLVSVLWVENCKLNQEHVSERMYPAVVPQLKGTPLLMPKLKKAKSMQPRDFEEEIANSAEKVGRKRKKLDAINRLRSSETTPSNLQRVMVLVQDTQPRSPDDGFVLTPIRLTIPDTPPSMREKMRQMQLAKERVAGSYTNGVIEEEVEDNPVHIQQLQRRLFKSTAMSGEYSSTTQSPGTSSVFMSDTENEGTIEEKNLSNKIDNRKEGETCKLNVSAASDTSVNDDIFKLARNINTTLSSQAGKSTHLFGVDSDDNLLSSQEIMTVVNATVKLNPSAASESKTDNVSVEILEINIIKNGSDDNNVDKNTPKSIMASSVPLKVEEMVPGGTQRRSSRRLSIQQVLKELDKSNLLDILSDENSNSVPSIPTLKRKASQKNEPEIGNQNASENTQYSGKERKSCRNSKGESKPSSKRGSRNNPSLSLDSTKIKSFINNESVTASRSESTTSFEENKKNKSDLTKTVGGKKSVKKKLLSLTDLTEQHSVLIIPTKCSEVERPVLEPVKAKRGRKKKVGNCTDCRGTDNTCSRHTADTNKSIDCDKSCEETTENVVGAKKGRKRKSNECSMNDVKCSAGQKMRSSVSGETGQGKTSRGKKTLANDTHVEDDDVSVLTRGKRSTDQLPVSKLQDLTTQLNLTKDNGLMCSTRETTLSLSMSTAYTDANMPSFLISQRRSIDEFSATQRRSKKQKLSSVLISINEKENCCDRSSSDTDRRETAGKKRRRFSSSQHGRIVCVSLVMTSLHSDEQDIVISVVKKLGGFVIAENVNETTSHIICGESRRTLNVLHGLARGIWLLSKEWVITSLEAGRWIPEAEFECTTSFPTCKTARLEHEKTGGLYRASVFAGIGPVYISGRSQPPRHHLVQLLKLCGGQVIGIRDKASIYLGSDYHPGMTCVKTSWLLDCITSHQLLPMDRYFLDRPKRESSPVY